MAQSTTPPRWRQRILLFVLLPPACVAAWYLGVLASGASHSPPEAKAPPPRTVNGLRIEPDQLELGEVWEVPEHGAVLSVRNDGAEPVTISRFVPSCDCSGVEPEKLTIPPGQAVPFTVKIDLTHRLPHQIGMARRSVSVRLDPIFAGDQAPSQGWELKADIRSRVSLETQYLTFADMCVHDGKPASRKARASVHVPLTKLEAVADVAAVRVEPVLGEDGQFDIVISPDPKLPVGPFKFDVTVTAVTPDDQRHLCASITVNGDMQPPTRILPAVILFGDHPLGEKAEAFVTVRLPSVEWGIDHIETDSADTIVVKAESVEEGVLTYRVEQQVTKAGDQMTEVRFVVRRPDGRLEPSAIKVYYHGKGRTPRQ